MSVLSVQRVQITLAAGTASDSATLSGVTDVTNCVPFMSKRVTTLASPIDDFNEQAVDITFAAAPNRVIATTSEGTTRALVVEVGVVEFDGTDIEVNSGTFQLLDTEGSTTENPGLTDMDNAFLIAVWQRSGVSGGSTFIDNNVRPVVTSESVLTFDRANSTGQVDGHWYTVESTDGSFTVQHATIAVATSTASGTATITSVAANKTFLVGGWKGGDQDDCSDSCLDVVLTNSTTITATRNNTPSAALDWAGCAVTFTGSEIVQRGAATATTATNADIDIDAAVGTLANCIVFTSGNSGSMTHGLLSGSTSGGTGDAQTAWTFVDDNTVRYDRNNTNGDTATISFEVIEWDVGGAAPAARRVMVIS